MTDTDLSAHNYWPTANLASIYETAEVEFKVLPDDVAFFLKLAHPV